MVVWVRLGGFRGSSWPPGGATHARPAPSLGAATRSSCSPERGGGRVLSEMRGGTGDQDPRQREAVLLSDCRSPGGSRPPARCPPRPKVADPPPGTTPLGDLGLALKFQSFIRLDNCMEAEDSGFDSQRGVPQRWYSRCRSASPAPCSITRSTGCVRSQHPPRGPMDKASAYGRLSFLHPPRPPTSPRILQTLSPPH